MEQIHIRICNVDENAGIIFLQFATDATLTTIEQATVHGFFPRQYQTYELEKLLPMMADFGRQMLEQQQEINKNKLTTEQANQFRQWIGTINTVPLSKQMNGQSVNPSNVYNPDSVQNPNGQIDQMRNIVLEILAEEGLIPGAVK